MDLGKASVHRQHTVPTEYKIYGIIQRLKYVIRKELLSTNYSQQATQ